MIEENRLYENSLMDIVTREYSLRVLACMAVDSNLISVLTNVVSITVFDITSSSFPSVNLCVQLR